MVGGSERAFDTMKPVFKRSAWRQGVVSLGDGACAALMASHEIAAA
jgi:3-hydroxyisobutyrate dehydrogenase-like beta-hydroxyacid dehydrogenase